MSDKKKTGVILSYRTVVIIGVAFTAFKSEKILKSVDALQRLPNLIETIERHTNEIEANRKATEDNRKSIEEFRDALKRNKLVDFDDGHREHATLVFLP